MFCVLSSFRSCIYSLVSLHQLILLVNFVFKIKSLNIYQVYLLGVRNCFVSRSFSCKTCVNINKKHITLNILILNMVYHHDGVSKKFKNTKFTMKGMNYDNKYRLQLNLICFLCNYRHLQH